MTNKIKSTNKAVFIFLVIFSINLPSLQAQDFNSVSALSLRVAPWTKNKIVFHSLPESPHERFELITKGEKLNIYASSLSAAAMGFNYYLNHFCHQMVSHGGDNLKPLAILPVVKTKLVIETPFQYRYALNYVTYNYSMSFYQWKDWEKELDWMALHGVNLMKVVRPRETITTLKPTDLIKYALSLKGPDVIVLGLDSIAVVKSNLEILRSFKPMDEAKMKEMAQQLTPFFNNENLPWMKPGYCDGNWT